MKRQASVGVAYLVTFLTAAACMLLFSCENSVSHVRTTEGRTVSVVNPSGVNHKKGDTVFVRQTLVPKSGWEVLPDLNYTEGMHFHTIRLTDAETNKPDTFRIGFMYLKGVAL